MAQNVTRRIAVDDLVFANNVRTPECQATPLMVESYRRHGFKANHPLVLSEKPEGKYLVLCGNRRGMALRWLCEHDLEAYNQALPEGKVPAIVHKGLTEEEETLLRIDHSADEDRVPLDEWSIYLAIKQLAQVGMDTQERIAIKLGLLHSRGGKKGQANRSYVQPRLNLARLPSKVEEEMRKYTLDKTSTAIRWSCLATLWKAYNREFVSHPAGDGPLFMEAWEEAIKPRTKADSDSTAKGLTPADAVKRAQIASSQNLSKVLLVATGQSSDSMADLDQAIIEGETAVLTLKLIADYLGADDYVILIDSSREAAVEAHMAQEPVEAPA